MNTNTATPGNLDRHRLGSGLAHALPPVMGPSAYMPIEGNSNPVNSLVNKLEIDRTPNTEQPNMQPPTTMTQTHLAKLLGLSRSSVCECAARGMPTDSLEAAQAWRRKHLDIARRKDLRPAAEPAVAGLVARASALQSLAQTDLAAGRTIADLIPALRASLAAVPPAARDRVDLMEAVLRELVAHVSALLPPREGSPCLADGQPIYGEALTDAEAQEAGEFWYQVAAGEVDFPHGVAL